MYGFCDMNAHDSILTNSLNKRWDHDLFRDVNREASDIDFGSFSFREKALPKIMY